MISMPLDDAIVKIEEKTELSKEQIKAKIDEKLNQLSGLVSKEGAAYIIANELGVKLFEQTSGKLEIKNILTGMRDVETVGKVTRKFDVREFQTNGRSGKVGSFIIGDESGTIRVVCWGTKADELSKFNEGDIIQVKAGYVRENNGQKEVHMGERSDLVVNPEGIKINKITETQKVEAVRTNIKDLNENSNNVELFGTIVQSFEPRFFEVCPTCGKRAKPIEGDFVCAEHQKVNPDYSYVMNVVLDDGTETIRSVFFRENVEKLTGKSKQDILSYRASPQEFDIVKNDLLGKQIKIVGRATKNQMFDRIEFITNFVDINPDPKKEIQEIEEKTPQPPPQTSSQTSQQTQ